MPDK
jgi:hypothetical protein